MRRTLWRVVYAILVFVITVILTEAFTGISGREITTAMPRPALPVITMDLGAGEVNELKGVSARQPVRLKPSCITPLHSDRKTGFTVTLYDAKVEGLSYEIRDPQEDNLIEASTVDIYTQSDGILHADIAPGNLIEPGRTYTLLITLSVKGRGDICYSSDIYVCGSEAEYEEAIAAKDFARLFHEEALHGAEFLDLTLFLEPDGITLDNDFSQVNIHNSAGQVTYGELMPVELTDSAFLLTDVSNGDYTLSNSYLIQTQIDDRKRVFECRENFVLRNGPERFFLIDYERTMQEILNPADKESYDVSSVLLGVGVPDRIRADENGRKIAFVQGGRLYEWNQEEGELVYVYGFDEPGSTDMRALRSDHNIRILRVSEDGGIVFLVSGYMNAGSREGLEGLDCMVYHSGAHTVEELFFIPSSLDSRQLSDEVLDSAYLNDEDRLHISYGGTLYEIQINTGTVQIIETMTGGASAVLSDGGRMAAWDEVKDGATTGSIVLTDFSDSSRKIIEAKSGEKLVPMGFIGEDLVYGSVLTRELSAGQNQEALRGTGDDAGDEPGPSNPQDKAGADSKTQQGADQDSDQDTGYMISTVWIVDKNLEVLSRYEKEDIRISGFEFNGSQLTLHRVARKDAPAEGASLEGAASEEGTPSEGNAPSENGNSTEEKPSGEGSGQDAEASGGSADAQQELWEPCEDDQILASSQVATADGAQAGLLTTRNDGAHKRISVLTAYGLDPAGVRYVRPKLITGTEERIIQLY